jgi:sensor domain CHASE-containing protein
MLTAVKIMWLALRTLILLVFWPVLLAFLVMWWGISEMIRRRNPELEDRL